MYEFNLFTYISIYLLFLEQTDQKHFCIFLFYLLFSRNVLGCETFGDIQIVLGSC